MNKKALALALLAISILLFAAYTLYVQNISTASGAGVTPVWVIQYADGTITKFHTPKFQMMPLVVFDPSAGKVVTSVLIELYATVQYSGQALNWSTSGQLKVGLKTLGGSEIGSPPAPFQITASGSSAPPNGQAILVRTVNMTSGVIEYMYSGWTHGQQYNLYAKVLSFTFTITFVDGARQSTPATLPESTWTFTYYSAGTINSVSLSWAWTPYY